MAWNCVGVKCWIVRKKKSIVVLYNEQQGLFILASETTSICWISQCNLYNDRYGSTWIVNETKYNLCLQVSCTDKLKFGAI